MERVYKIERDLENIVSCAMEQAKSRLISLMETKVREFDESEKIKREINCLHIGGNEKEIVEFYPLYSNQIRSIRDTKGRPYRTIVGLFFYGRNKDLCYISDNTAYYFYDFNKVLIGNFINWYRDIFGDFE